jgi:general secretion pathway protein H
VNQTARPLILSRDDARAAAAGFSLVEMMTVLFLIGLVAGGVMLTRGRGGDSLGSEGDRLAVSIREARDLALLRNRPVAIRFTPEGYETLIRSRSGWRPAEEGDGFIAWMEGSSARIETSGSGDALLFDATGLAEPARITIYRQGRVHSLAVTADGRPATGDGDAG